MRRVGSNWGDYFYILKQWLHISWYHGVDFIRKYTGFVLSAILYRYMMSEDIYKCLCGAIGGYFGDKRFAEIKSDAIFNNKFYPPNMQLEVRIG